MEVKFHLWRPAQFHTILMVDVDAFSMTFWLRNFSPSFFFFQAEDVIRDTSVTGVQTCALPIWWRRGPKREILSRGYNLLLHTVFGNRFTDAQCGFKAIRRDAAHLLLPAVMDDTWFFDTEIGRASCRERVKMSVRAREEYRTQMV